MIKTLTPTTINNLLTSGAARRWTKNGEDRAYLTTEALLNAISIELDHYGEKISNAEARRILDAIRTASPYVDLATGEIIRRPSAEYTGKLDTAIRAVIEDAE